MTLSQIILIIYKEEHMFRFVFVHQASILTNSKGNIMSKIYMIHPNGNV